MIEAYKRMWKNGFNFSDRTSRGDYWKVALFHLILIVGYLILMFIVDSSLYGTFFTFLLLYIVAAYIPLLSICIRRLHDINKSGWFYLLDFIPYIGGFILLILTCMKTVEPNKYGKQV